MNIFFKYSKIMLSTLCINYLYSLDSFYAIEMLIILIIHKMNKL